MDLSALLMDHPLYGFPELHVEDIASICRADLIRLVAAGAHCFAVRDGGGAVQGVACIFSMEWDTQHFSMPMYRVQIVTDRDISSSAVAAMLRAILEASCLRCGGHVSAEVNVDNYTVLNVLLEAGFEILDFRRTYVTNRMRADVDFVRMRSRVRPYQVSDYEAVMSIVRNTDFPSRFGRDSALDQGLVKTMYTSWFDGLLSGTGKTSSVMVYERAGEIIACGGIGEKDFSYAGVARKMRTNSLYTSKKGAVGAYAPVLYQLIIEALQTHDMVETTASLNNRTVCRIIEGFRSYKSASSSCSLRLLVR